METPKRIRIETGARLHFGLLDTAPPFGGLGAMIDQPTTIVDLSPADQWNVRRGDTQRINRIAERFSRFTGQATLPAVSIDVITAAPPHRGFGSGTQLSLAIAEGLRQFTGLPIPDETLAVQIADRGKRSAVGVHGFFGGGMIFETGDDDGGALNPIRQRVELPPSWRLLTLSPSTMPQTVHGQQESDHFAKLQSGSPGESDHFHRESLLRLINDDILPAARAGNFSDFARAIESYNYTSGMMFAATQGGPYNGRWVTDLVASLQSAGATGVGQSSWGPGVFVWCEDEPAAERLADQFADPSIDIRIARIKDSGRTVLRG
ncbi:GHMP family kinase ATP-binding protein [Rhodopirellula sp. JC639]|uniref:GHMP family kinase ATP-binding protein n=1 Tax=Stieleria mannarensis TaxID=2755585 RepID=UPI00160445DD|nr:beta-ribofuranosylaminobenzene 5'-phosphate synthase [Rhodopirellula sp. JC639]